MPLTKYQYSQQLCKLLQEGNFKEIINFPPSFEDLGMDGQRILLHSQGAAFAAMGAPQKAKMTYLKALKYGENVQIFRDLACTYYQLEEFQAWRETYQLLHNLLQKYGKDMDFDSRFTSSLTLAKFFEEEGKLGQALGIYERLNQSSLTLPPQRYFYLLAPQLLRLKSQLPSNEELSRLYTQLLSYDQSECSSYINVEVEHSLMLAELNLIGVQHAWSRVKSALENRKYEVHDKRLFFIDFIEESFLYNVPLNNEQLKIDPQISKGFSKYEREVYKLAQLSTFQSLQYDLATVAREMPIGSYLKLLNLYATRSQNENLKNEFINKMNLIVAGFSTEDRTFWIKRSLRFNKDNITELTLDSEKRAVNFQKKVLDVSRKKQALQLLKLLANKPQWTIDDAIANIWHSSFSPEHFNRLRMTVHRTNVLLEELTTKEKCIEISGEKLNLHPSVKISNFFN